MWKQCWWHLSSFKLKRLWISFFVSSPLTSSRSARQIRHPDPARRIPNSRPKPWAPPVMIALFPLTSNIFNFFFFWQFSFCQFWQSSLETFQFFSELIFICIVKYRIICLSFDDFLSVFFFCAFVSWDCFYLFSTFVSLFYESCLSSLHFILFYFFVFISLCTFA